MGDRSRKPHVRECIIAQDKPEAFFSFGLPLESDECSMRARSVRN